MIRANFYRRPGMSHPLARRHFAGIPEQNVMVDCLAPHCEVMELATKSVWQSGQPISRADYDALELEPGLVRIGLGVGAVDAHGDSFQGPVAAEDRR
jgi:hypothetical protein